MTTSTSPTVTADDPAQLTVIGVDGSGLSAAARETLATADVIVGAPQLLDGLPDTTTGERLPLGRLEPVLDRLRATASTSHAVILAGGDPGLFGIVRRLRMEGLTPEVVPAVSHVATLFARLGLSWESAAVVSAHGRDLAPALNACRALPVVAVLTGPGSGPAELGAGLVGWPRRLSIGERLGTAQERVVTDLTPEQAASSTWAEPNTVVTLPEPADPQGTHLSGGDPRGAYPAAAAWHNQPAAAPEAGWALPEDAYTHRDSMITKQEVRALALARLRPRIGQLIWDVGAGSGSVGIECAALGAAVIAVEADPRACDLVRGNAARHQVTVRVVPGRAPQALTALPDPDAVFLGGGGTEVLQAVVARRPPRLVATFAGLDRLTAAVQVLRDHGYQVDAVQLSASRLANFGASSLRLTGTNPIVVLTGERS
jgi:precorrin-6Y C5,15-methyltransferase (decarboxylating)